jgi:carbon storage regulator
MLCFTEDAMLVLTRKPGEKLYIGEGIIVTVLSAPGGRVRLGIEAPDDVPIVREELSFFREDKRDAPLLKVEG